MFNYVVHEYFAVYVFFLGFWVFSRNRLAGDEEPPGGSSLLSQFLV